MKQFLAGFLVSALVLVPGVAYASAQTSEVSGVEQGLTIPTQGEPGASCVRCGVTPAIGLVNMLLGVLSPIILSPTAGPVMVSIVNPIERMLYSLLGPVQQMVQGKQVRNITAEELNRAIQSGEELQLIDTRSPQEYEQFRLEGTVSVPFAEVQSYIESGKLSKDKPVVFICCSGMRGYFAGMLALTYGYDEVYNLIDGLVGGWMKADLPLIS